MNDKTNVGSGGVFFPVVLEQSNGDSLVTHGITRRDWLAGLAMQGLIPNADWKQDGPIRLVAKDAYKFADAMIAEGRKE